MILPTQLQGHFIHGPLTVVHVFNDYNVDSIRRVFNIDLDRLCDELNYSDIGIVYTGYVSSSVISLLEDSVNMRCGINTDSKIAVCRSDDCYSAQWPAVIVLYRVWFREKDELTELYLMLSRARVYCSVVIFPQGETLDSYPYMLQLLDKLSNYARIIRH